MPVEPPLYAQVLLDDALDKPLDYLVPQHLKNLVQRGTRVAVPVRTNIRHGTVLTVGPSTTYPNVKPIESVIYDKEGIPSDLFLLADWMSKYYCTSLRVILKTMMPSSVRDDAGHKEQLFVSRAKTREELIECLPGLRKKAPHQASVIEVLLKVTKGILLTQLLEEAKAPRSAIESLNKKGLVNVQLLRLDRSPLEGEEYFITSPKKLNSEQAAALSEIQNGLNKQSFQTHLLYGITGSGKTEVYLQAIDTALSIGKTAIMMVPEIALTTQMIERFRCRFKDKMAILHHRLSDGERYDAWHSIRNGESKIVIGARSAIFCPMPSLGLIIVDEEHENSYKQGEKMPCYNARDVAVMRGKICQATVVLGSATPSLESFHNAQSGKYSLLTLTNRADSARLPKVTVVDMRKEYEKAKGMTSFSEVLLNSIEKRLAKGEQTILFLNRRGYHTMFLCRACGVTVKCPHCDTSLTFHKGENNLSCHLCGHALSPPPRACPSCHSDETMKFRGMGTEHVERSLHAIFPEIRTLRADADTTKHKGSHQKILRDFATGKADVLVGTQMIAKGLHFPEVTLVGVLNCDSGLQIPDYRASENTFQLLAQVAGRAGRGAVEGEVIIQTALPEHAIIQHAARHDFQSFFKEELATRSIFGYPPYSQLVKVGLSGSDQMRVQQIAEDLRNKIARSLPETYEVFPALASGHPKIKDKYRFQFLIRGPGVYPIIHAYNKYIIGVPKKDVLCMIDVNPYSTFF